jgi:hypothetical protein
VVVDGVYALVMANQGDARVVSSALFSPSPENGFPRHPENFAALRVARNPSEPHGGDPVYSYASELEHIQVQRVVETQGSITWLGGNSLKLLPGFDVDVPRHCNLAKA